MDKNNNKKPEHYISNRELLAELIACQQRKRISNDLGEMFLKIARNYSTKPNFVQYTYREDMVSAAVLKCCEAYLKFDTAKSDQPFSFFTTVIHNSFLTFLTKEQKQQRIKDALAVSASLNPSAGYEEDEEDSPEDF